MRTIKNQQEKLRLKKRDANIKDIFRKVMAKDGIVLEDDTAQ